MLKIKIIPMLLSACIGFSSFTSIAFAEDTDCNETTIENAKGYLSSNIASISTNKSLNVESCFYTNKNGGHGFAAERANNLNDVLHGKEAKVVGGDNIKNGADRIIKNRNGTITQIQDKYYRTASESVNAAFDENGYYKYLTYDGSPMQLEVSKDQYNDAVELISKKIEQGKIEGVSDPSEATNIVRQGSITYQQAVNITKAGNIDSLVYDAKNGTVIAKSVMGISFSFDFAISKLNGCTFEDSLKSATLSSLKSGAFAEIIYVLSSQLARTNASTVFKPAASNLAKMIGPSTQETLLNLFSKEGSAVTKDAVTKVLQNQMLLQVVTFAVMSTPEVIDCFRGRISSQQLAINLATLVGGMAGSTVGTVAGGTLGHILAPGVGTKIGALLGGMAGGCTGSMGTSTLLSTVFQTDAEQMYDIILNEFQLFAENYLISQEEADNITAKLQTKLESDTLKDMYQSDDRTKFADDLLTTLFDEEVAHREKITIPTGKEVRNSLIRELEDVIYIH